jgi:hypothetical protein
MQDAAAEANLNVDIEELMVLPRPRAPGPCAVCRPKTSILAALNEWGIECACETRGDANRARAR